MAYRLKWYNISADGGKTWTAQWITENEANEMRTKYGYAVVLCPENRPTFKYKEVV